MNAGARAEATPHLRRLRGTDRCGYEGEHEMPESWECVAWKAGGGYANQNGKGSKNSELERIWFSPHCLRPERDELQFGEGEG